jgi:4-carboxymuconolactone decarboxylase
MPERPSVEAERLFEKGLKLRRAVLGADYVDQSLQSADDFMMSFQRLTTEWCWGYLWTREGLDRRSRSLINLGIMAASNHPAELRLHVRAALTNGVTPEEIKEALLQVAIYCGIPTAFDAFRVADEVLKQVGAFDGAAAASPAAAADGARAAGGSKP